jgi:ABC-2 type transport system permease protein
MWSGLLFSSTFDIAADRRNGTLEFIVGSPTSLGTLEAIRTLMNVLAGLISMLAAVLVAVIGYRYSFENVNLGGAVLSLFLVLVGLWSMGVFLANFLAWSRLGGSMVNYLETPVAVFCGFMYPLSILPSWMQYVSMIFPIRWALLAMNNCLNGTFALAQLAPLWTASLLISVVFYFLSRWLEGLVHDKIRVTGEFRSI